METPKSPSLYFNLAKHKAKLLLKYTQRLGSELTWLCLHQPLLDWNNVQAMFLSRTSTRGAPRRTCTEVLSDGLTWQQNPCTDTACVTFPLLSGGLQTCLQLSPSVTSAVSLSPCPQPRASGMLISSTTISYLQPPSPQESHSTLLLSLLYNLASATALTFPPTPREKASQHT